MSITIRVLWTAILAATVSLSQSTDGDFGVELRNTSPARPLNSHQRRNFVNRPTFTNEFSRSNQLNHGSRSTYQNPDKRSTNQKKDSRSTKLNIGSRSTYPKELIHHNRRLSLPENKNNFIYSNEEQRHSHQNQTSRPMPINKRRNIRNKYRKQTYIDRTRRRNIANRKRRPIHRNRVNRPIQNIVRKSSISKKVQRPTARPQVVKKDSKVMLFANICHPEFLRLGNGCYYFSKSIETWQGAHFACKDMESSLAVVESPWEDLLLRRSMKMKNMTPLNRWLGGIYDWEQNEWVWGQSGETMKYKSFLTPQQDSTEGMRWTCSFASPRLYYHWSYTKCTQRMHFICEAPFKRVPYGQGC